MDTTVAQFTVVEIGLLSALTSQFGNTSHRLTLPFAFLDLILQHLRDISMDMEVVIDFLFDKVTHIFIDAHTVGRHCQGAKFDLRLTLKHRFLHIDGNGSNNTSADITIFVFTEIIADGSGDMLLEGTLMGTALGGMLTVDERVILLTILVGMGKGNLDILTLEVDDGIECLISHAVL